MPKKKLLLIGWDAADWRMIDPLLAAGEMPHLQGLINRGARGNLATIYPALSPMLWTSIATGKRPYKHGIHGFSEPLPDGSGVRPITNLNRSTKALWNILSQESLRSLVVGWWPSHPAEPINGVMVSNFFHQEKGEEGKPSPLPMSAVHPPELAKSLRELRVNPMEIEGELIRLFVPEYERVDQAKDKRLHSLGKTLAETMSIHAAAMHLLPQEEWDFAAIYYDSIDHFGHGFMKYHPPRLDWIEEKDFEIYQHVMVNAYRYHDLMLGALLQHVDDDTTVILMSDHGFHPDHKRPSYIPAEPAGPAVEHGHFGILCMSGPQIEPNSTIYGASLLDICPSILALMDLPTGKDMDGKVLTNVFKNQPQIKTIESWDDVPGEAGMHPQEQQLDAVASAQAFEQLVELGYVAPPAENVQDTVNQTVRELKYNLARAYADGSRFWEAIELAEELWENWPKEHRFGIMVVEYLGQLQEAERRGQALDKLQMRIMQYRKEAQIELDDFKAELEKAPKEELSPQERAKLHHLRELTFPRTMMLEWMMLSQAMLEGRANDAMARIQELASMPDLPADIREKISNAMVMVGETDEAETWLKQMVRDDPQNYAAHANLAKVYLKTKRYEAAIEAAVDSLSLIYFQPALHTLLGKALLHSGRYGDAEQTLQVALSQHAYQPLAHELLVELYRKHLNRPELADDHESIATTLRFELQNRDSKKVPKAKAASQLSINEILPLSSQAPEPFAPPVDPQERITIVSGLPRSGTSMMMQLLTAGGIEALSDNQRIADEGNPLGYFEFEQASELQKNRNWLPRARGKAVKIVAQLLNRLPANEHYQIIFMRRDLDEVVASQKKLLDQMKRTGSQMDSEKLKQTYAEQLRRIMTWLTPRNNIRVLVVDYHEILSNAEPTIVQIADMLERPFDQAAAGTAVRPELHRQKA
ncbi:alkaline phosphatase family protein [Cerasicoccus frondis]|uniref:alkaline phosphatase family protein n=1 Tax=Cerasicoccus frondis TaxID=490090 RepID=UPI00285281DC|nr:alkaline phosphatase family protein [Cerasicoccus frondis]